MKAFLVDTLAALVILTVGWPNQRVYSQKASSLRTWSRAKAVQRVSNLEVAGRSYSVLKGNLLVHNASGNGPQEIDDNHADIKQSSTRWTAGLGTQPTAI